MGKYGIYPLMEKCRIYIIHPYPQGLSASVDYAGL